VALAGSAQAEKESDHTLLTLKRIFSSKSSSPNLSARYAGSKMAMDIQLWRTQNPTKIKRILFGMTPRPVLNRFWYQQMATPVSRFSHRKRPFTLLTPAQFDVISVQSVDEEKGFVYYIASPDNPTQHYLFRSPLDGTGKVERITPANQPGTHQYQISPDSNWAFHTYSSFDKPP
jgi:hypothetical protein